jgi:DNA-binding CsgD family transcriptional regulator
MKGPEPIAIPEYVTIEWYRQQKELGRTDKEIADSLFISYMTFHKWKQKIGWNFGEGLRYVGRKRIPHTEEMKRLRSLGYTYSQIAEIFEVSEPTVERHIKRY